MRYFIYIILLISFQVAAQKEWHATDSIAVKEIDYLGFDSHDFHYYVKNNNLYKTDGNQKYKYSNVNFQNLDRTDFFVNLKTILFYKNFNSIIVLDNFLNEIQKINFSNINVEVIAFSSQNELWFYDNLTQKFGLYNLINQNYKLISVNFPVNIKDYFSDYNYFYFINDKDEIFRINRWGKIDNVPNMLAYQTIYHFSNQTIFSNLKNELMIYDVDLKKETKLNFKEKNIEKYFSKDQKIAIFTGTQIINFQKK